MTKAECQRRYPHDCFLEQCAVCHRDLAHDAVHWNGAFYQCEDCSTREARLAKSDPRACVDPIFGGYTPAQLRTQFANQGDPS
jgi:hypothetical protein